MSSLSLRPEIEMSPFVNIYFVTNILNCPNIFNSYMTVVRAGIAANGEERAGCFAYFVFLVSRDGWATLPGDATGLSVVCDCGIS